MDEIRDQLRDLQARLALAEARLASQGAATLPPRGRRRARTGGRPLAAIALAILLALVPAAALAVNPFTDLNPGSAHNANIDAIYSAGITTGCDPGVAYCPNDFVTREEMASFLARTAGLGGNPPVAYANMAVTASVAWSADRATWADTATNANLLDNRPGRDYARVAQFRLFQPALNHPGPLPYTSPSFTTEGGDLLVLATGSGHRTSAGTVGMTVMLLVPEVGSSLIEAKTTTNEAGSHKAFTTSAVFPNVPPGAFQVVLTALPGTDTDLNDYYTITVVQLPRR